MDNNRSRQTRIESGGKQINVTLTARAAQTVAAYQKQRLDGWGETVSMSAALHSALESLRRELNLIGQPATSEGIQNV